jgi:hypothetical protein
VTDFAARRYAGAFRPDQIPGVRAEELQRKDIANYFAEPSPKAAAYNVYGFMTVAKATASQRQAEEAALLACRNECHASQRPAIQCHLYAIENRVVLPLRATTRSLQPRRGGYGKSPPRPAVAGKGCSSAWRSCCRDRKRRRRRSQVRRLSIVGAAQGAGRLPPSRTLAHRRLGQSGDCRGTGA